MKLRTVKIIHILETAAITEKFMPKPKLPKASSMYDLLEVTYESKDEGYYHKSKPRLRANNKQIESWELALDLLPLVAITQRRLLWARAFNYSWVALAKMFSCHRVTVKKKYLDALFSLEKKLTKNMIGSIDKI